MVAYIIVVKLRFVFFVRVGTNPLTPAVFPVANDGLQPAWMLTDFLEVVAEPAQVA